MIGSLLPSFFGMENTKKIDKQKAPNSISEFRMIRLGNYEQTILIRGKYVANPTILVIHGRPDSVRSGRRLPENLLQTGFAPAIS